MNQAITQQVTLDNALVSLEDQVDLVHKKDVDYAKLIWEDFQYQNDYTQTSVRRRKSMPYPRFTKVIISHFLSKHQSISIRNILFVNSIKDYSVRGKLKFVNKEVLDEPKGKSKGTSEGAGITPEVPDVSKAKFVVQDMDEDDWGSDSAPLLDVPVSVILEKIIPTPFTTPLPTPQISSEAPTITTTVLDPLPAVIQRLSNVEKKFKSWTKVDHFEDIEVSVQANLINKLKNQLPKSCLYLTHDKHQELCDALLNSIMLDKAIVSGNVNPDKVLRKRDRKDNQDASARSYQGMN
nr:hypothetical protein [Tanacetum cinerariifolium]